MTNDHIVNEIRAIREQIAKESDYDIHKIFVRARASAKARKTNKKPQPTPLSPKLAKPKV